eukprot:7109960-Pyramimonas_sp.AAC.1
MYSRAVKESAHQLEKSSSGWRCAECDQAAPDLKFFRFAAAPRAGKATPEGTRPLEAQQAPQSFVAGALEFHGSHAMAHVDTRFMHACSKRGRFATVDDRRAK